MIGSIINGKEINTGNDSIDVKNPYNGKTVEEIVLASDDEFERAVTSSFDTFHNTMKDMPAHKRSDILRKTADLMEEQSEDFAEIIMKEAGKPIFFSRGEVQRAIQVLRFRSEERRVGK